MNWILVGNMFWISLCTVFWMWYIADYEPKQRRKEAVEYRLKKLDCYDRCKGDLNVCKCYRRKKHGYG